MREADTGLPEEDFLIGELVTDELEQVRPLLENKPMQLELHRQGDFCLPASPRVRSVVVGNLLRNACHYTARGRVVVTAGGDFVQV